MKKVSLPIPVAILTLAVVSFASCGLGSATGGDSPTKALSPLPAASTVTKIVKEPAPAVSTVTVTKEVQVPPPAPKDQISDGTKSVGPDIPPGTYRVVGAGDQCYWAITKTGSNGGSIVNNHIGGGNLTVTLQVGQDFETQRCG